MRQISASASSAARSGAISPRKGIPFGTWHQRFIEWAADLNLIPAPAK